MPFFHRPAARLVPLLIILLLSSPSGAQDNPILQRMAAFTEAYNAGDAAAVAGFYSGKGALLPPQSKALVGRQLIAAHHAAAFAQGVGDLTYKVVEIDQTGPDTAIEIGETRVKVGKDVIFGRSVHIWKRVDGVWSLHRDMYHVTGVAR